MKPNFLILKTV